MIIKRYALLPYAYIDPLWQELVHILCHGENESTNVRILILLETQK